MKIYINIHIMLECAQSDEPSMLVPKWLKPSVLNPTSGHELSSLLKGVAFTETAQLSKVQISPWRQVMWIHYSVNMVAELIPV